MDFNPIGAFSGIYLLIINGKNYIGSSKNINRRITEHKRLLRLGTHYNSTMQREFSLNSEIKHYCIKECEEHLLFEEEQKFLDLYKPELNESLLARTALLSKERIDEKQGGERNHMAKITLEKAIEVVRERNNKLTLKEISDKTEVSYPTVVYICSAGGWKADLEKAIPEEYKIFTSNVKSLGLENKGRTPPSNRLFNDTSLLNVLHRLMQRDTLQSIADTYNTSKAVISSIKNLKVYKKDIERLLTTEELNSLRSLSKTC